MASIPFKMTKKTNKPSAEPAKAAKPAAKKTAKTAAAKAPAKAAPAAAENASVKKIAAPAKASAPAKAAAPKKGAKLESPATIIVRHDAGWGNHLHLRGEGPGLSWDAGVPLCCVHGDEWVWVAPASGPVTFKVLHNDTRWATGENLTVLPGETVTIRPVF